MSMQWNLYTGLQKTYLSWTVIEHYLHREWPSLDEQLHQLKWGWSRLCASGRPSTRFDEIIQSLDAGSPDEARWFSFCPARTRESSAYHQMRTKDGDFFSCAVDLSALDCCAIISRTIARRKLRIHGPQTVEPCDRFLHRLAFWIGILLYQRSL